MFVLFRSFIVWSMLLALPYQGYAAAAMMVCAPAAQAAQHAPPEHAQYSPRQHAAMFAAMQIATSTAGADHGAYGNHGNHAEHSAHGAHVSPHPQLSVLAAHNGESDQLHPLSSADGTHGGHADHAHGSTKCGGAACCVASAPVLAGLPVVPVLPAVSGPVPFYAGFIPAVHLAHPDRPPQVQQA